MKIINKTPHKYKYIVEVDLAQMQGKYAEKGWRAVANQRKALETRYGVPVELIIQFINETPVYTS